MLDISKLKAALPDFKVLYFDEIDSTNSEAKRRILAGEKGKCLYIASHQTAGRGRQGKSFYSPADTGLYMSFSYPAGKNVTDAVFVTSQSSVAVAEAIEDETGLKCCIKWVNDIYIGQKKVSGILAESVRTDEDFIIVGIGINLFTDDFPDDIKDRAGSLGVKELNVTRLAARLCHNMAYFIDNPGDKAYLSSYRAHSNVLGERIEYVKNSVKHEALAVSLTDEAYLKVLKDDGTYELLNSGEISLRVKED